MFSRREMIGGGMFAGAVRSTDAIAAQGDPDYSGPLREIQNTLRGLRDQSAVLTTDVAQIRDRQRQFYRLNQRFPEFIDVGIQVWERMQDWHITHQRPLTIQRAGDGRWQMEFLMSVLVLRHEFGDNEVGQAYDR